jgi:hypothetical protein
MQVPGDRKQAAGLSAGTEVLRSCETAGRQQWPKGQEWPGMSREGMAKQARTKSEQLLIHGAGSCLET